MTTKKFTHLIYRSMLTLLLLALMPIMANSAPSTALTAVKFSPLPNDKIKILLTFNKPIGHPPSSFLTKKPVRLILDFADVDNQLSADDQMRVVNVGALTKFRALEAGTRTRIVLLLQEVVTYSTTVDGNRVSVVLSGGRVSNSNLSHRRFPSSRYQLKHSIRDINFSAAPDKVGRVTVNLSDGAVSTDVRRFDQKYYIDFLNTRLPKRLQYRLDVNEFGTPVQRIDTTFNGNISRITMTVKGGYEPFSYQVDKQLVIEIRPRATRVEKQAKLGKRIYKGKKVSLNFQDIKVRQILQLIADVAKINIVVTDTVQGNMTLRLNRVPWDQALDIILKTRGLAYRRYGSVLMVAPATEIASQEKAELQAQKEISDLAPLTSDLMQLNYAKASEIATLLKDKGNSLLSTRGNVSVDERTNTLWVQDIPNKIVEVRELIHRLDRPVQQVLIEARVVLVNKDFERDLGVRFGATKAHHLSGTLNGANSLAGGTPAGTVPVNDRLNINLPANPTDKTAATIGIALAKLANGTLLDLELSALESEGAGEVVSTPRVITANKQPALIESGKEVPYQEATSSGATSVAFKKAVLSLNVTPQITPDKRILLDLKVNQDTVDEVIGNAQGVPNIITKEINTHVLVDNGQTLVLGGIYQRTKADSVDRVPFLGRIPIIGNLFRSRKNVDKREELLIFVTPKIIRQHYPSDYTG